jgi:ABC-type uncharacterized transport system substrate-binding protein
MERTSARRGLAALTAAAGLLGAAAASAHPHMWIDARATIEIDAGQRITALRQVWLFDEMFGAYATQGLKKGKDGSLPADVRQGMAQDWMKALGEPISHYFTRVTVGGKTLAFAEPRDARVDWNPKTARLTLSFTLPLAEPAAPGADGAQVDIYDPTYFVAYAFDGKDAVALGGPQAAACTSAYRKPKELDWKTLQQLAAIPADPDALPDELFAITKGLTHRIKVRCP